MSEYMNKLVSKSIACTSSSRILQIHQNIHTYILKHCCSITNSHTSLLGSTSLILNNPIFIFFGCLNLNRKCLSPHLKSTHIPLPALSWFSSMTATM
ncbi:unnamed protein product [Periconia digitata]|uniref:Uncharacterized protein n=1 Tax=Periconia digitata TaxID=1303443 RepID=A0A9W4UPJ6_9PLEO|nr:unnamed protein product [Periconia digitata]